MKPIVPAVLIVIAALLASGCVAKSELEEAQAQLAACQEERAQAEAEVASWERRFDRESSRWEELGTSVADAVPQALRQFEEERTRILEAVPDQVQTEVATYLDDYFATVMQGFELLSEDNSEIKLQLQATQKALEAVGADTRDIGLAIDEALAEEKEQRQNLDQRLDRLAGHLSDVVEQVVEFDQTRINCKRCPERLRLNRKERETILGFHAELMSDLSDLQARAGELDFPVELPEPAVSEGSDGSE